MTTDKLRVWWISNPPRKPFIKDVSSVGEAKKIIDILSKYDLYLGDLIYCNACGLEIYNTETEEWEEWEDMDGNDVIETSLIDYSRTIINHNESK